MSVSPARLVDYGNDVAASEFHGVEQLECPVEPFERQEVVLTEDIAPLLREYIDRQNRLASDEFGVPFYHDSSNQAFCGVVARLAFETSLDERNIFRCATQEGATVDLGTADALMMAMNRTIHELPIYLAGEVRSAVQEQSRLIRTIARARGIYVPTGKAARTELPRLRRLMAS